MSYDTEFRFLRLPIPDGFPEELEQASERLWGSICRVDDARLLLILEEHRLCCVKIPRADLVRTIEDAGSPDSYNYRSLDALKKCLALDPEGLIPLQDEEHGGLRVAPHTFLRHEEAERYFPTLLKDMHAVRVLLFYAALWAMEGVHRLRCSENGVSRHLSWGAFLHEVGARPPCGPDGAGKWPQAVAVLGLSGESYVSFWPYKEEPCSDMLVAVHDVENGSTDPGMVAFLDRDGGNLVAGLLWDLLQVLLELPEVFWTDADRRELADRIVNKAVPKRAHSST